MRYFRATVALETEKLRRIAAAFSLRQNLRLLLVPRPEAVPAVTGIRAISMLWVLLLHIHEGLRPLGFTPAGAAFLAHPLLSIGWAGNVAMEMFFVISGYLIGGMLLDERTTTGSIRFRSFWTRRALRVLPTYGFAMAVYLAFPAVDNKENVWANVFFANNFLPFRKQFMAHTWSLALEEQFFLLAPIVVLLLHRARPAMRIPLLLLGIMLACVISVGVVRINDLELSLRFPSGVEFWRFMDIFYTKPYTRFGSLAMGILVATLERDRRWLHRLERRAWLAPVLGIFALAAMVFVTRVFPEARGPSGEKLVSGSLLLALEGYLFGAGAAYVLFVSRTNHWLGRWLNAVLGLRVLHVFAQLSFAMYLFHPICLGPLLRWLGFDLGRPWRSYALVVFSGVGVSALVGIFVFLLVELPLMRLRPRRRAPT
jgi:peptidoglycan/LPS O-acetylase OafA/YrhL